jgi:holo-[acyl-carrier protein] synthase
VAQSLETPLSAQAAIAIGVDIVRVAEVTAVLSRFGERYVGRVYTPHEAAYCDAGSGTVRASRFAARFAAKEAAVKALAPTGRWTDWRAIEVRRQPSGACSLALYGDAAALAGQRGIRHLALTMSHEGDLAVACVVALGAPPATNTHPVEFRHV